MLSNTINQLVKNKKQKMIVVACNVYVSAGRPHYRDLLKGMLIEAQDHCRRLNRNSMPATIGINDNKVVLVHAFCDGPYDRSSFHIAGSPESVVDVASSLATHAVQRLEEELHKHTQAQQQQPKVDISTSTAHPTVGLVDHVSVLPLTATTITAAADGNSSTTSNSKTTTTSATTSNITTDAYPITGWVAHQIGRALDAVGVDVLYYGYATPSQTPLATVRRELTTFFQGPTSYNRHKENNNDDVDDDNHRGQATVGAPEYFTENYNIRLRPMTPKSVARSLTKHLRTREGTGLPFVEALTLPYNNNDDSTHHRYEVACNLLNPEVTSTADIQERLKSWEHAREGWIETSYRVGTTAEMCWKAWREVHTSDGEETHNRSVMERFETYFQQQEQQLQ
jgi:glutamate formiminotransferase